MPSRPKRISLSITCAPGRSRRETPLPASLMRPPAQADDRVAARPANSRRRADRCRRDCPRCRLSSITRAGRRLGDEDAGIHRREVAARAADLRPRTTAPGASTVMTLPLPPPSTTAPGSPSSVSGLSMRDGPAMLARRQNELVAGRGRSTTRLQACRRRAARRSAHGGAARMAAEQPPAARRDDAAHSHQRACGSTNMRPFISMCIAWQNHEQ